jgi:hypothetical protein
MKDDAKIAAIARRLGNALQDFAYSRRDEDKRQISQLHYELVRAVIEETETEPV